MRYSTSRRLLELNFGAAEEVTKEMIKGDFDLNSPKEVGESETITVTYPDLEGNQVFKLNAYYILEKYIQTKIYLQIKCLLYA